MSKRMIKMSSIGQFRNIISNVKHAAKYIGYDEEKQEPIMDRNIRLPIIKAVGSEKIHGTNASVCFNEQLGFWVQSRENIITVENDNAGCAFVANNNKNTWLSIIRALASFNNIDLNTEIVTVYFEWAGGSIQKNTALSGLDKKSFIFRHFKVSALEPELDVNGNQTNARWLETFILNGNDKLWIDSIDNEIYNVMNFKTWDIQIDFERPSLAQNEMIKIVEEEIEPNSPLGRKMGKDGNIGEGMVVTFLFKDVLHKFKVKGEKHSNSKVKTLKPVDTELEQKKIDFANYACSASRLEQAWQTTFGIDNEKTEPDVKATGDFLRAVINDVWKEECDIAAEKGLEPKQVNSFISKIARTWFMGELDKLAGI